MIIITYTSAIIIGTLLIPYLLDRYLPDDED
jgi:hypothetical protein